MVDVPLGTLIFRAGLLAEEQLEDALQEGMRTGKRLGEVLLERGWLHERDLGRMLAGQKGLPFVEIHSSDAEPAALEALPMDKARMQTALPLRFEDGELVVAVADPSNELVLENLRRALGAEPKLVVAAHGDLVRSIEEAYGHAVLAAPEPALPEPPPAPVQPEPLQSAPPPAPAVTPLPTVLPPAEERSPEPELPALQPLVTEPVAQVVEPVLEAPPLAEPPAVEPVAEAPAPVAEPPSPEPVLEAPAPLLQPPTAEPALEAPAPLLAPTPVEPTPASPAETAPPLLQPAEPVADAPVPAPLQTPEPLQPSPLAPPSPVEAPAEVAPPLLAPMEEPTAPEPPPAAALNPDPGSNALHIVLLRLREGDVLEVGTFNSAAEASARAQEVVRQIATAEGEAAWPFFAERYLRPDTIVSVDMLEESADKWLGSAVRSRWANQS